MIVNESPAGDEALFPRKVLFSRKLNELLNPRSRVDFELQNGEVVENAFQAKLGKDEDLLDAVSLHCSPSLLEDRAFCGSVNDGDGVEGNERQLQLGVLELRFEVLGNEAMRR